ncbi:phage recombination protein Bet [Acinetobacter schindleri]|nr:phage recombination protein Bet [Acinetobacter schindleri]MCU4518670.1 phage recombination protein Bet [Acinetobacter schindleri]
MHKVALAFDMADVDPEQLKKTLIDTVFKGANDVQLVSLLIVANQYKLNPFTREIYAFPAKGGGITPVVGIDGWARIINDNPLCDGIQFEQDNESCTCKIYRKDRTHPTVVTEYLDECQGTSEPWKKYPKRMLRHKALIQCARVAFGFSGIYDEDEAKRIDDCQTVKTVQGQTDNVIPEGYQEFENEHLPSFQSEAQYGSERLQAVYANLPKSEHKRIFWTTHSVSLKQVAELADQALARQGDTYDHSPA